MLRYPEGDTLIPDRALAVLPEHVVECFGHEPLEASALSPG